MRTIEQINGCNQACAVRCDQWNHLTELRQVTAKGTECLGALPDQQIPDPKAHVSTKHIFNLH